MGFWLKFWGVRGSIACPTPKHVVYGGNTSCIEVGVADQRLVLDCGTGLRQLGQDFLSRDLRRAHILLTHTHWDHINGFPFFGPANRSNASFEVIAGHLRESGGVRQVLAGQMTAPMFPVPMNSLKASLTFQDIVAGDELTLGPGLRVKTAKLNHPDGATGYRIEYGGKSLCYVTDTEHVVGQPDQRVLELIEGADLVIYDSTYTDDEYPAHKGWGHSTWQEGVRLARAAEVKKLVIFHHDPEHEDAEMARIENEARQAWEAAIVAREQMTLDLG